jgi:hypothetical protein
MGAEYRDVKLAFLDLVDYFNPGDGEGGVSKALKPEHWPHSLFHPAVILLDPSVYVTVRPHDELNGQYVFLLQLGNSFVRGRVPIKSHFLWYSPLLDRLPKEALRGSTIAVLAQEEVDG